MPNAPDTQSEQEIKDLILQWLEAARDRDDATLDRILADDFIIAGWQPEGRLADKKFYIEDCMTPVDIQSGSYRCDAWKCRFYDDLELVNFVLDIHAVVNGHEWGGTVLVSDVWKKGPSGGNWRVLSRHTSPIR